MQPSGNTGQPTVTVHDVDYFGRAIFIGDLVAAAGVREMVIGHIYRLPDHNKDQISMGVKELKTGKKHTINLGLNKYVRHQGYVTRNRVVKLDDSYLDL